MDSRWRCGQFLQSMGRDSHRVPEPALVEKWLSHDRSSSGRIETRTWDPGTVLYVGWQLGTDRYVLVCRLEIGYRPLCPSVLTGKWVQTAMSQCVDWQVGTDRYVPVC